MVIIMAMNKKTKEEEVPFPIDGVSEENTTEQVKFEDLMKDFEADYTDEDAPRYLTISGKEQEYEPAWQKYSIKDLNVGDEMEGRCEITHFVNEDRKSDSLRVRIMDDGEILDLYVNIPKPDELGYITNIRRGFDFYRTCYDFIFSVLKWRDERNVVDSKGNEVTRFKKVNIINFAKFVDQMSRVGVRITEGNSDSDYDSFIIYKME